jgi:hypothetical protein
MVERLKPKNNDVIMSEQEVRRLASEEILQQLSRPEQAQQQINNPYGGNAPATLTQENIEFLDGINYVPEELRNKYWGLISVNNMVSQINSPFEQRRVEAGTRSVLQTFAWAGDVDPREISQVELAVRLQQLKSKGGIERRLLAPQLTEQVHKETILEDRLKKANLIDKLLGKGGD